MTKKVVEFLLKKVSGLMPDFELRQQQLDMIAACANAIENEDILLAEAGTGTGKTFAYLIPIILSNKRAVISTKTINLQEQLFRKDLSFLAKLHNFTYSLAKGRSNYLCLRRLYAYEAPNLFENKEYQLLKNWAQETKTGDISDSRIRDLELWDNVNSDSDSCLSKRCKYYDHCFYYLARKKWHQSKIIVSNHALTTINALMSPDNKFFADTDCLIVDEAHSLDHASTHAMMQTVSDWWLNRLVNKLLRFDSKNQSQGLLSKTPKVFNDVQLIKNEINKLFSLIRISYKERQLLREPFKLKEKFIDLGDRLLNFCDIINEVETFLENENEQLELVSVIKKLHACAKTLLFCAQLNENYIHWIEITEKKASINIADMYPAEFIQNQLLPDYKSVILTSATLSTGNDFTFIKKILGIGRCVEFSVPSPYDVASKVKIQLHTHISPNSESAPFEIAKIITSEAVKADGGILVLFTSKKMMQQTWKACIKDLTELDVIAMIQGEMHNKDMLEVMRKTNNAVLFGLDSFWEGVDVKGDSLKCIIIAKLPFDPPDDPITMARIEDIKKRGDNPFVQYSLPRAILKFKQGFGRLIRSHSDTGRVIICDPRIKTRPYGQLFFDAIINKGLLY